MASATVSIATRNHHAYAISVFLMWVAGVAYTGEVDPQARCLCCHGLVSRGSPPAPGVRLSPHRALHVP